MTPIRVFIYFHFLSTPWGGSNSFLKSLERYLATSPDVTLCSSLNDSPDIVLISSWSTGRKPLSLRVIRNMKRWGYSGWLPYLLKGARRHPVKIIHRLDGIGRLYGRTDQKSDFLLGLLNNHSDRTVLQSRFCVDLFQSEGVSLSPAAVIYNGVDQSVFHFREKVWWDGERPLRVAAVSWSANPRKGHAVIAAFSELPGVEVRFIGNWAPGVPRARIHASEPVPFQELASFYRSCDVFLFPAEAEACPNVVLEAASCGLPLLYHPSGGTPEIAKRFGVPLASDLSQSLDEIRRLYPTLIAAIQADYRDLSIERAGTEYLTLFRRTVKEWGTPEAVHV